MYTADIASLAEVEYERFAELAEPSPLAWLDGLALNGGRALHAGCGSGITTVALARQFSYVVGADNSTPLIRMAQVSHPHPRIEYQCADLAQFEDDEGFDFIFAYMTIHDVDDADASLANLRRLARPGAMVLIIDRVVDSRWVSYLGSYSEALVKFPLDLRRLGRQDAFWVFKYRLGRSRLSHLADDCHFSGAEFTRMFSAAFPGCRFLKKGSDTAMLWDKPQE